MTLAEPWMLVGLVIPAAVAAAYLATLRRRGRDVVRFTGVDLLDKLVPHRPARLRHVPVALLVAALALLAVAAAGPIGETKVPRSKAVVMLVIDTSLSMQAVDVTPSRLAAAKEAAGAFVRDLPATTNVGLVSFAAAAAVLQSPTMNRDAVVNTIHALDLAEGTATGDAISIALQSIDGFTASLDLEGGNDRPSAQIVLLSDGGQTVPGRDMTDPRGALTAADKAIERGVPVHTISFGTGVGAVRINGRTEKVPVDDDAMRRIAERTHGEFRKAETGQQLGDVYRALQDQIGFERRQADVSRPWFLAGALLVVAAIAVAMATGRRIPA